MAIEVRKPRPGTPLTDRSYVEYWNDLRDRTGGDTDLIDQALNQSGVGLEEAEAAQASANAAQVTANSAVTLANAAQATADDAVADAAAAQVLANAAQADANDVWVTAVIADIDQDGSSVADGRMNVVCPVSGTVTAIYAVVNSAVTNATALTCSINGVAITSGVVTVAALSVQGAVTSATPTALNAVAVGNSLSVSSDGAAGATCRCSVLFRISRA